MTRRRAPSPPESAIQAAIMQYLRMTGWYAWRVNAGALRDPHGHVIRLAPPGTPDVQAFRSAGLLTPGRVDMLFVEVKRPENRPTEAQLRKMAELRAHGARCIVATCVEDVQAAVADGVTE